MTTPWIGAAALVLVAGCGSGTAPADKLAKAQATYTSAEYLGAGRVPAAALQLKVANDRLSLARELMKRGENDRADGVLTRAQADAEVAMSLTQEASAREEAQQTLNEVQSLRNGRPEGSK